MDIPVKNEKEKADPILTNRKRVQSHRIQRKNAGLKEVKFWVKESDVGKVHEALRSFLHEAENILHEAKGGKWLKYKPKKANNFLSK